MKALLITSLSLFITATAFRFLHWPFAALLVILSVLLIFVFSSINTFSKKKSFNITTLGGWVLFSWSVYILYKYMYWYAGPRLLGFNILFIVAFVLTVFYIAKTPQSRFVKLSKIVLFVSAFGFIFSFVPSYSICYLFDLSEPINSDFRDQNYRSWDKYSWFLYIQGEEKRALEANQKAMDALDKNNEIDPFNKEDYEELQFLLKENRQGILDNTWDNGSLVYRKK